MTGLDVGAQYEVRLRAMNRQGWSTLSESFIFNTAGEREGDFRKGINVSDIQRLFLLPGQLFISIRKAAN